MLHNWILCYNCHTDPAKPYDALHVCVPAVELEEVFKICHEGMARSHRGVARTLDKFQRTFSVMMELFSELKILHTRTSPYNPSSNIVEQWHRTIVSILQTMGSEKQNEWDLGVKVACLALMLCYIN